MTNTHKSVIIQSESKDKTRHNEREEKTMAIIKINGFVVGVVKASEIDIKKVEANGFVVVFK